MKALEVLASVLEAKATQKRVEVSTPVPEAVIVMKEKEPLTPYSEVGAVGEGIEPLAPVPEIVTEQSLRFPLKRSWLLMKRLNFKLHSREPFLLRRTFLSGGY